ncbi:MAG: hypothetical protein ACE37F_09545 [Nannocystaceae bacterium]|nr:hypothetical protein [bacterium]
MATLECKASQGRIVVYVGDAPDDAEGAKALADARAFGIELGEKDTYKVRLVPESELPTVADVLHSAFAFPLDVAGPVHLGTTFGESQGSWSVEDGPYWGALYEVFPDCEEAIGAQYVLVLAKQDALPEARWAKCPHLTDAERTPGGESFPDALALPGDAMDDASLPDLGALFGALSSKSAKNKEERARSQAGHDGSGLGGDSGGAKASPDAVASRLFAAIANLGDDEDLGDDDDLDDAADPEQHDPFYAFIKKMVAEEQLALVEGASARKLAERLELALERDPMMFQRPGDWFFEQREVDELFASDEDLMTGIRDALNG